MDNVLERVKAMPVMLDVLPGNPTPGSAFDQDARLVPFATYDVVRTRIQDGIIRLLSAAHVARDSTQSRYGTHLITLRPALVAAAKGWWLVDSLDSRIRTWRACCMVAEDRRLGAEAMKKAQQFGGPEPFAQIAAVFERAHNRMRDLALSLEHGQVAIPRDSNLLIALARQIDMYYGTSDATSDAFLLWNSSSSLAHGERWYPDLFGGARHQGAVVLTERSFDIVCSGIHVLAQRTLTLASTGGVEALRSFSPATV